MRMFNITNMTDIAGNYSQQLNSILADPNKVPDFNSDNNSADNNTSSDSSNSGVGMDLDYTNNENV